MPFDLETEQFLLGVVDRIVFQKSVLHRRVNPIARDGEGFSIGAYVEHVIIECVRAVEISRLPQFVSVRITEACDILQPMIAFEADRFDVRGYLRVRNAIRCVTL
jgi:hypothetical protein